jgi:hypothetical protein
MNEISGKICHFIKDIVIDTERFVVERWFSTLIP